MAKIEANYYPRNDFVYATVLIN
uniref:Uncharacterized protein n=1 Tax=Rhizophora mucronata TaxID=61149 RepID=A0A2P2NT86_RHIMU